LINDHEDSMKFRTIGIITAVSTMALQAFAGQARAAEPTKAECATASNASLKLADEHKLRAMRAQLLICTATSCKGKIRDVCLERMSEVNHSIPSMVFKIRDGKGNDLSAVKVTMDGEVLAVRLDGTAIDVEPGDHKFVFETAGQAPVERSLLVQEAEKNRLVEVTFGPAETQAPAEAPAPVATAGPTAAAATGPATAPAVTSAPDTATTAIAPEPLAPPAQPMQTDSQQSSSIGVQRTAALIVGGVGVVGIGIGSIFGLQALSKKSSAHDVCPDRCADQSGVDKWNDAVSAGKISTIGFIVGGVGLAGAAAMWFTGKPTQTEKTQVGIGPSGLQLKGTW
jgi:hypothetical protein